jgi:hypothetical protein
LQCRSALAGRGFELPVIRDKKAAATRRRWLCFGRRSGTGSSKGGAQKVGQHALVLLPYMLQQGAATADFASCLALYLMLSRAAPLWVPSLQLQIAVDAASSSLPAAEAYAAAEAGDSYRSHKAARASQLGTAA